MSNPADPLPHAPVPQTHDPYVALRYPNYRRYFIGNTCATIGTQMAAVTVGWELYARTDSAVALGLVGLIQILPILILSLPAGHFVDRFNRKIIVMLSAATLALSFTLLGFSSRFAGTGDAGPLSFMNRALAAFSAAFGERSSQFHDTHIPILFILLLLNGICKAINQPAKQSLLPMLIPAKHFSNAVTWNSSLFELSNVAGPMLGGTLIYLLEGPSPRNTWAFAVIYWLNAFCQVVQFVNLLRVHIDHTPRPREPLTLKSMLAGVHFVYHNKVILGAITLDMFAVLLGGATALLPLFAKDILHVGPASLGWLRAAPSIGALTMAIVLAHSPPMLKAGRNMLWAIVGFGLATIIFGLSHNFWLSFVALILTGVCDNISVVVRHTLVQLLTPDNMRGRVNAVNSVFISSSNELGEFESGATAAIGIRFLGATLGPMIAVAAGGVGTILVVTAVAIAWPQVAKVGRLTHPKNE